MIDLGNLEVAFALMAVRQASLLVKQVQAEMVSAALTKEDRSPVTVADFAAQALVAHLLEGEFPEDPLVAEEDAGSLRPQNGGDRSTLKQVTEFVSRATGRIDPLTVCEWIDRGAAPPVGRYWTLDPIDGTKGFLRGDQYAVALALVVDGEVQVGVLGCPNLALSPDRIDGMHSPSLKPDMDGPGILVISALGQGTWATLLNRPGEYAQLSVSACKRAFEARLLRSFESGHTNVDQIEDFSRRIGLQAEPVRMDSQAKYAVLASGGGEILLRLLSPEKPDYREKIWDHASGALILREAGGQITDLAGKPLDFTAGRTLANNRGILASNGLLHRAALQALEQTAS